MVVWDWVVEAAGNVENKQGRPERRKRRGWSSEHNDGGDGEGELDGGCGLSCLTGWESSG